MTARRVVTISAAVEGIIDEAITRKLIVHAGGVPGPVYGKNGKPALRQRIAGYNNAARHAPWLVLVDLDRDEPCAPPLRQAWLPDLASGLCFRVAVRTVEAWLMADSEEMARFLMVARGKVPSAPETLEDPKRTLVALARGSRRREIREGMVPRAGSGRPIGPLYTSKVLEYVEHRWRPDVAAERAQSLARAIARLGQLVIDAR